MPNALPVKHVSAQVKMQDMTRGPLFGPILRFFVPLTLSYTLQLLFHAADLVVIGRFSSRESLAAVGATAGLTALFINVFAGVAVSADVLVSQYYGARDFSRCARAVHCCVAVAVYGGIALGAIGIFLSRWLLHVTDVPEEIFRRSLAYLVIVFASTPFVSLYNFGSGILRAVGDTRRPFCYLTIGGVLNVFLNILFVVFFHWDVVGVALGTLISQGVSAYLVSCALRNAPPPIRFRWKNIRWDWEMLRSVFRIGIPAGFQSSCYSISNTVIQSTVNSFGTAAIAGNTAATSIDALVYFSSWAFHQTALSFCGQNFGAGKVDRVRRCFMICVSDCIVVLFVLGLLAYLFRMPLLSIYSTDPETLRFGSARITILCLTYFTIGLADTGSGAIRALGKTIQPAMMVFVFVCLLRILWVYVLMGRWHNWNLLLFSYPVSWTLSSIATALLFRHYLRKWQNSLLRVSSGGRQPGKYAGRNLGKNDAEN